MSWGARDLTVRYGSVPALEGIDLSLGRGSIAVVVGGDGAGKSTLLKTFAGARPPTRGEIAIPDRSRIGYMSPGPGIYRDLTVAENLAFAASAYGVGKQRAAMRAKELAEHAGLSKARGRLGGNLSGGMRQKLALITALIHEPDLLVLDEPTTGVDPVSRAQLWQLIARSAADGAAVLVATSYVDEAGRGSEVLVLSAGRPLLQGPPQDVLAKLPGSVFETAEKPEGLHSWRRGRRWRVWSQEPRAPQGGHPVEPDMEDALIVAALNEKEASPV